MWKSGGRRNPITFSKLLDGSVYFFSQLMATGKKRMLQKTEGIEDELPVF